MPFTNTSIGDLIKRVESLLTQGSRDAATLGSGFGGSIGSTVASSLVDTDGGSVASSLTSGLLGGGGGWLAGLLGSLFRETPGAEPILPSYEKPGALFFEYDMGASQRTVAADAVPPVSGGSERPPGSARPTEGTSPTVVVQVNALDAQSFSARSDDIASAVREALARNHSLRDEIWED